MSIWHSLDLPEPIRSLSGGDIDVAWTVMEPEHGVAIRIWHDDGPREDLIELSVADAVRLRDAIGRAVATLHPAGLPPAPARAI